MSINIEQILDNSISLLNSNNILNEEAEKAVVLLNRLHNRQINISVAGQFKRGKSTLINTMLSEKILPTGIIPITSCVTKLVYGDAALTIVFENGINKNIPLDNLHEYINEQENPNNEKKVAEAIIHYPSAFLENGVTLVDTPGVGSYHKHNTKSAYDFIKESDAVVFLLSVDSPINQIEIEFLDNIKEYASKLYFAINKIDTVSEDDLNEYLVYCKKILCRLIGTENVMIYPVSAKKNIGIQELEIAIRKDFKEQIIPILEESVAKKMQDIIETAILKVKFYWNALSMPIGKLDIRFRKMQDEFNKYSLYLKEKPLEIEDEFSFYSELALMKAEITKTIKDLFNVDYLPLCDYNTKYNFEMKNKDSYGQLLVYEYEKMTNEIEKTLSGALLYKENNAITVAYYLDDMNKLEKKLKFLLKELKTK